MFSELMPGQITLLTLTLFREAVVIGGNGFLRTFSYPTGQCIIDWVTTVRSSSNCVYSLASLDDRWLVFGSEDGFIRFFDVQLFAIVEEFPAHDAPITYLEANLYPNAALVSAADGQLRLWREGSLELMAEISIAPEKVRACERVSDREQTVLAVITQSHKTFCWNPQTETIEPRDRRVSDENIGKGFILERKELSIIVHSQIRSTDAIELSFENAPIKCCCVTDNLIALSVGDRFMMWRVKIPNEKGEIEGQ
jgi:WD40 repeat protein